MPKILGGIFILFSFLLPRSSFAMAIAEQTQSWGNQMNTGSVLQELGDNLSGTLDKFTFRVSAARSREKQFNYTATHTLFHDRTTNTYISGCRPPDSNPQDF